MVGDGRKRRRRWCSCCWWCGRTDECRFLGCTLQEFKNGSCRCRKMDAFELSASVCVLMAFLERSTLLLPTKHLQQCLRPSLLEREEKALDHIVRFCPERKCPLPYTKNYIEVEGMISAFQCRHLFASKKYSFQLYFGSSACFFPATRANVITPLSLMAQAFHDC